MAEDVRKNPFRPIDASKEDGARAAERLVGSFAGWSGPNQFRVAGQGIMQCCLGNCARAAYYVWEHMLREEAEQATIELMLNRAGQKVDVLSELPYAGRLHIHMKQSCSLRIRKPLWLNLETVKIIPSNSSA